MYVRVLILIALLASPALWPMIRAVGPALIAGAVVALVTWRWSVSAAETGTARPIGNPIALLPALGFLVAVAGAALLVRWAQASFGESGTAWSLFIAGSFDVDAAIVTMAGLAPGALSPSLAALAIGGTVAVNMAFKMGVVAVTARGAGLNAIVALGISLAVLIATLAVIALPLIKL
jgi:uncharacterized membrane protein (DUF4010 family)